MNILNYNSNPYYNSSNSSNLNRENTNNIINTKKDNSNSNEVVQNEALKQENYSSALVRAMKKEQFESFQRVTDGMNESDIEQSIKGLEMINFSYMRAQEILSGNYSGLNENVDLNTLISSAQNIQSLPAIVNYGIDILSKMNNIQNPNNKELLTFMQRFSNSLKSDSKGLDLKV